MTPQEAIRLIQTHTEIHLRKEPQALSITKALLMAVEALEKETPKKPTYVDTRFRNHGKNIPDGVSLSKCYKCPNPMCGLHIFRVFDSDTHCKHCGQTLYWEDSEYAK